ncbi:SDR family oxidoreductase [Rhodococcus sp. BP-252]|uniref:SDR family oxidoreductase n=1 Tax=unclassified Rhodococcus (in: high G+C Gram-positive bacteria) TaxID=192944 RepID=UPI001430A09F|nr:MULTISPECIES: SDR family oxidoreductase [unclassified Rhodococcus (in: high G+C Gram-positive bacteria)]MBY6411519.1 SDR family oxidoreductase [Rhodococcus sp. BP-320]MBY6417901.1 SDR family oxidoreductase [Rhodococcus sp. BP-321]MBY6422198.1 SDR family oxidoreductase [Rhodococcus sp. BP-324]MBY6427699.1 SDR family oxidoreductase [Rhodococcus sp. BP-323]MBY6433082.1 SDR family oxidoreductase [Rhodococcus sp. BP-322]
MSRVVVFGGHGKVALRAAPLLVGAGHEVGAIVRNPDHVGDVADAGATPIVADIEYLDVAKIAALIEGYDVVVWSAGAGGGDSKRTYAVDRDAAIRSMDAAGRAGISRYVMVSYFGAGLDHGVDSGNSFHAYAQAKAEADDYLKSTSLDWTILGPSALTLDQGTGLIDTKDAGATGGSVTRDDVAAAVVAAIASPGTIGRFIEFDNGSTPIAEALG